MFKPSQTTAETYELSLNRLHRYNVFYFLKIKCRIIAILPELMQEAKANVLFYTFINPLRFKV